MVVELKGFKGLGRLDCEFSDLSIEKKKTEELLYLPISQLVPGQFQPRKHFEQSSIDELTQSIVENGVIQPLIGRQIGQGNYEIIAGERRWRAAKQAKLEKIPVIIRKISDETALALSLIENIQRESLSPIEEACALDQLKKIFDLTHQEIADRVGRSRAAVTNCMRLLTLNPTVKEMIEDGKLETGHAKVLLTLDSEQQRVIAEKIIKGQLTVRSTEKLVKCIKRQGTSVITRKIVQHEKSEQWHEILNEHLSTKIDVKLNQLGKGRIVIYIDSEQDFENLLLKIKKK